MNNFWFLIDRIKEKLLSFYRKKVFLARTNNKDLNLRVLGKVYVNATNLSIGKNLTLYPGVYFWGDGIIEIGDNVDIGVGTIIFSKSKVKIGNNVAIAGHCYIIDSNHSISEGDLIRNQPLNFDERGIKIGNDVWIGAGCTILKGTTLNDGVVVGAMSLVNCQIDKNAVAIGIPAKAVKYRSK